MPEPVQRELGLWTSLAELVAACRRLRLHLERRELASPEEISAAWPPDESVDEGALWRWVWTHGQLMRLLGAGHGGQGGADPRTDRAEEAALAALQDRPEPVPLSDGNTVEVHPKSFAALQWFDARDATLAWLGARQAEWRAAFDGGVLPDVMTRGIEELFDALAAERAHQLGLMAAQACTPGAALAEIRDEAALRFANLPIEDLIRIYQAHMEANYVRVQLAKALAPPRKARARDGRATWGGWVSGVAYRERADPAAVLHDRSLASQLTTYDLALPGDPLDEDA